MGWQVGRNIKVTSTYFKIIRRHSQRRVCQLNSGLKSFSGVFTVFDTNTIHTRFAQIEAGAIDGSTGQTYCAAAALFLPSYRG